MKKLCFVAVLMVLGIVSSFTDLLAGVIESFPSKTNMLVKLDFEKLRSNSLVNEIKEVNPLVYDAFCGKIKTETGINPDDVKTVWLGALRRNNGIVVLEGNFNVEEIKKAISVKPDTQVLEKANCEFAVMYPDKKDKSKTSFAAILNQSTIVAGSPEMAEEFMKNFSSGVPAQDFKQKNILPGGKLLEGVIMAVPQDLVAEKPFMAEMDSGYFEMDLQEDLTAKLVLKMTSEEEADNIRKIFEGMVTLQKFMKDKNQKEKNVMKTEFFDNLGFAVQEKTVTVKSQISTDSIRSEINKNGKKKINEF